MVGPATRAGVPTTSSVEVDAGVDARIEDVAALIAAGTGVPLDHVRELVRARTEALATAAGHPFPVERRYYPAGSVPRQRRDPRRTAGISRAAQDELDTRVATDMVRRGYAPELTDLVLAELRLADPDPGGPTLRLRHRVQAVAVVTALLLLGFGLTVIEGERSSAPDPDPGVTSSAPLRDDPDPDGAWSAPLLAGLEPYATELLGPQRLPCLDDPRPQAAVVALQASLVDWLSYPQLHALLATLDLPHDREVPTTTYLAAAEPPDDGVVVVIEPDVDADRPAWVLVVSPCGLDPTG